MNNSDGSEGTRDSPGGRETTAVLLVDTSSAVERHAVELEREFDDVVTVGAAEDALGRLSTEPVDCVVSTYELPDANGIELLERVRVERPTIPFVLWPDSGSERVASEAVAANVTGYVPRRGDGPIEYGPIVSCIRDATTTRPDSTGRDGVSGSIRLLSEVCGDLVHAETRAEAFRHTIQRVCESTGWDYGEVWRLDDGHGSLVLEASCPDTPQFTEFERMSSSISFRPNEGLPGRVWATASEEWISDISAVPAREYVRTVAVEETPLKTAFGVPVQDGESVDAVLVFYATNELSVESPLRAIASAVRDLLNEFPGTPHVSERDGTGSEWPFSFQDDGSADRSRESPFRVLADHVDVTLWMATADFDEVVYASSNFERITGVAPDEFRTDPRSLLEVVHPDDRGTMERVFDRCAETGESYEVELRILTANGRERWVRATGEPVRVDGEIRRVCGAIQDITERKNRERELRREREHLQQTERLAQSGGWLYNCETESMRRTDGVRRLFGFSDDHDDIEESFEYYHPDDRDTLIHAFERCRRTGKPYEIEARIVTPQGDERWIHEHGERITKDGVRRVRGAVRDITSRKRYENALKDVNTAARDLLTDETDAEIAHTVVDTATSVLDATGVTVYLYDEEREELVPTAISEEIGRLLDGMPHVSPGDSTVWDVFARQQPVHYADVRTADHVSRVDTPIRSEYAQPLGEYGVLVVDDTEIDAFSDFTRDITTILASTAKAALQRAERTRLLQQREQESQRQAQRLQRVEQLNEQIRSIIKAIVQAGSHETVKRIICDSLADHAHFEGVWIGEPNVATDEVVSIATSGPIDQYLRSVSLETRSENTLPTVQAIRKRTPIVEANLATRPYRDDWRNSALLYGFRSAIGVPLIYGDVLYGVLTIYSTRPRVFDESTVSVLTELGELIGYVLNSITQRHARLADEMVELRFVLDGADDVFVEMASRLDTSIHLESISTRNENRFLVHFTVSDTDPEDVMAVAESVPSIEHVELVADTPALRFEAITLGECVGTQIERLGAHLRTVTFDEGSCELQVLIPHDRDIETFVRHLNEQYSHAELVAHHNNTGGTSTACRWLLEEHLTDKQQGTLQAAYFSGYFDQTRKRTGGEIAESLGISQPGFAKQLRAAEYNLLSALLE